MPPWIRVSPRSRRNLNPWACMGLTAAILCLAAAAFVHELSSPNSFLFGPCLWHGPENPAMVALTFDDGPDPCWTPRVLRILKAAHVPATFFLQGVNVTA